MSVVVTTFASVVAELQPETEIRYFPIRLVQDLRSLLTSFCFCILLARVGPPPPPGKVTSAIEQLPSLDSETKLARLRLPLQRLICEGV